MVFMNTVILFGQENPDGDLSKDYIPNRGFEQTIPKTKSELIRVLDYYKDDVSELRRNNDDNRMVFNNRMMNVFFTNELNSFATSLKDFSLETNFSNIDTDAKTLTIGKNINWRELLGKADKDLLKTSSVLTFSVTGSIDKNFSKVYSYSKVLNEYNFASDLGINLKYTYMCNGIISYDDENVKSVIVDYRDKKLSEYINKIIAEDKISETINSEEIEKKYYDYYKKIADKEIEYYKENQIINSYSLVYFSIGTYIPLTYKEINTKADNSVGSFSTEKFRNWKVDGSINYFRSSYKFTKGQSLNFRINGSIYNNNNFIATNVKPLTFQTIINQNTTQQVLAPTDLVFVGNYNTFTTSSLRGEISSLFFKNSIGLSAAVEQNFGEYDAKNWKLGIPVSLKNKDDKPTVNFEIQWKEINGAHTVGVSAGYVFGKFLK